MTITTNNIPVGGTEQSELVTVAVNGDSLGVFDTWEGGDAMATSAQHRSGGQKNQTSYRTLPKYTDMKVSRVLNLAVDWELVRDLVPQAGVVPASVTVQPLDSDQNAYGNARTATGMFLGVDGIKGDSTSEALQMFGLNFSVDSWA
jgi:hypothetical protein